MDVSSGGRDPAVRGTLDRSSAASCSCCPSGRCGGGALGARRSRGRRCPRRLAQHLSRRVGCQQQSGRGCPRRWPVARRLGGSKPGSVCLHRPSRRRPVGAHQPPPHGRARRCAECPLDASRRSTRPHDGMAGSSCDADAIGPAGDRASRRRIPCAQLGDVALRQHQHVLAPRHVSRPSRPCVPGRVEQRTEGRAGSPASLAATTCRLPRSTLGPAAAARGEPDVEPRGGQPSGLAAAEGGIVHDHPAALRQRRPRLPSVLRVRRGDHARDRDRDIRCRGKPEHGLSLLAGRRLHHDPVQRPARLVAGASRSARRAHVEAAGAAVRDGARW